ncbi:MAG: hypothetical protein K5776_11605 [Lachnospiraceae bacterium]|nr:hypothetical protein [Lachnospiraceae bacterium]
MDCTKIIDQFPGIYCVLSLRKNKDGEEFVAITAANKRYLASVGKENEEFVPNLPYTDYIAPDPNFESMVKRCISTKKVVISMSMPSVIRHGLIFT